MTTSSPRRIPFLHRPPAPRPRGVRVGLAALTSLASLAGVVVVTTSSAEGVPVTVTALRADPAPRPSAAERSPDAPNIVTVMLDDVDVASVEFMPTVQRLRRQGATFDRHTASYSLCCPSRSTYLTGQYAHNHGIRGNFPPYGGYANLNTAETLPVWLEKAGYATAHIGKYLNGYNALAELRRQGIPPGWTEWYGSLDPFTYNFYNYVLNVNGRRTVFGRGAQNYQTDVYTDFALDFIDRRAPKDAPFFLDVSYLAAHFEARPGTTLNEAGDFEGSVDNEPTLGVPPVPAPRHRGMFAGATVPRVPSYNEADVSDKPADIVAKPRMTAAQRDYVDHWYQRRLESLQSADEGIAAIVKRLKKLGEWDDTYLIITSDNGYQMGEHRIWLNKVDHYEPSTRLPLVILGPGVERGGTVRDWTSNVDIHATILDLAEARRPGATFPLDGVSLVPYLRDTDRKRGRVVVHEAYNTFGAEPDPTWQGVRVGRWKWISYRDGTRELYDVLGDPYELENLAQDPAYARVRARLDRVLDIAGDCAGRACVITGFGDDWGSRLVR